MFSHMDINIFKGLSDIDKFLITAFIFLIILIIQHFLCGDKKKEKEKDSLLTSFGDVDDTKK